MRARAALGWLVAKRALLLREAVFLVLAAFAVAPLWLVEYPPIQDLPQHLAAIRVLHDYRDPALGFASFFVTALGRTQYLAYYLATHLMAFPLGVELANRVFVTLAVAALPYGARALLKALGRDPWLGLFAFPLLWNAHLLLGFVNFIAAITLTFFGLALAVNERLQPSRARLLGVAALSLVTFYMHVVPFAFLAIGVVCIGFGEGVRRTLVRWLALLPSAIAAAVWTFTSPAGGAVRTASGLAPSTEAVRPQFQAWSDALREAPAWLTDILPGKLDEELLIVWGLLVLLCIGLGAGGRKSEALPDLRTWRQSTLVRRLAWLAPLAGLAYFVSPVTYSWIWPINARFPLLALLFLIVVLPSPTGLCRWLLLAGVASISVLSSREVATAFRRFQKNEVAEFESALAAIPVGQKVAGLIWDRGSAYVKFAPFLHAVAWYQAKKGGAVMFTFADFPQSPFRFRESNRPPRVGPRWEWMPESVNVPNDLSWYDYVLVRGGPGGVAAQPQVFSPVFQGPHWSVWKRAR